MVGLIDNDELKIHMNITDNYYLVPVGESVTIEHGGLEGMYKYTRLEDGWEWKRVDVVSRETYCSI